MRSPENQALDDFGRFLSVNLRDCALDFIEDLIAGRWQAPALRNLQASVATGSGVQQDILRRAARTAIDAAIHNFLFQLQEQSDGERQIVVISSGHDVGSTTDGLHGEIFTAEGWFARYSAYGVPNDDI
jgi:hypothetical protein